MSMFPLRARTYLRQLKCTRQQSTARDSAQCSTQRRALDRARICKKRGDVAISSLKGVAVSLTRLPLLLGDSPWEHQSHLGALGHVPLRVQGSWCDQREQRSSGIVSLCVTGHLQHTHTLDLSWVFELIFSTLCITLPRTAVQCPSAW